MHIVFFQFVPHYGGAARSCVELAKRLSRHVDVSIVDPYGCDELYVKAVREAGIDYHVLCPGREALYVGGRGNPLRRAWRMSVSAPALFRVRSRAKKVLKDMDPSVICSDNIPSAFLIGTSRYLRHIPLTVYLRGWYRPAKLGWKGRWLCKNRLSGILAVSYATMAALSCSGVDPRKMSVLQNPIDVDEALEKAHRPLEAPLPQVDRPVRILLPAGIMRAKGQHTAVMAMRRILDAGHDAVLWIAGDHQPVGANKYYLDQTKALAEQIGVSGSVEWLGLRHDIPQLMKASTIVILPSHTEGHPRVTLEAMALAKPLAATPAGGIMDMITPEMTGLYFDVDDEQGLAMCIDRFVNNPEAAERMGRLAQEYIRLSFTPNQQTEKALEFFRKVATADKVG